MVALRASLLSDVSVRREDTDDTDDSSIAETRLGISSWQRAEFTALATGSVLPQPTANFDRLNQIL